MKPLISQCIYSIMVENDNVGQGFFADGLFITAAHVVKDFPKCYIKVGGKRIKLSEIDPILIGEGDVDSNPYQIDAAVYKLDAPINLLHLSSYKPQLSDSLKNYCVCPKFEWGRYTDILSVENALLLEGESEEGNYFYCRCNRGKGSSGSPLLKGTDVVGIMHGGDKDKGLCAFLRIDSILFSNTNRCINPQKVIERLLPHGIDRTMAIVILHSMNRNIEYNLEEEGIFETGYNVVLDKLCFNPHELTSEEKEILSEYCVNILSSK